MSGKAEAAFARADKAREVAKVFREVDAVREVFGARDTLPTLYIHPHIIVATTDEAEDVASEISKALGYEQITGPLITEAAAAWEVGTVRVSGLLSDEQKDRYLAASRVGEQRTVGVVLGDD